eukprot:scaffold324_cov75-Cylindrotheca_fusiformis.AAC.2
MKSPVLPRHKDDDDDDSLSDEDDDNNNMTRLNSMTRLVSESWRAVESAALAIPSTDEQQKLSNTTNGSSGRLGGSIRSPGGNNSSSMRSSVGRLGGSIRGGSIRSSLRSSPTKSSERTSLLHQGEDDMPPPPALLKWIWIALACAICYALYNISIKKGSASINPILGGVILQFVAALLGSLLLGIMMCRGNAIYYDKKGIVWSIGAGLWVGTAEIVSFLVSGMGVPATQFIPIIIGGSVMFGSILGVLTLGETVMLHGWSGVVALCIGIAMVATDPGEKVKEGDNGDDSTITGPPPLLIWIGPALFCALAYALYNICIKKGSASINPIVGAVILQFVAALYGSCILGLMAVFVWDDDDDDGISPQHNVHYGILWACWAGIFVGVAELLSFCVSGMGVQASQSIPIIIGGSVGFGAVLGLVMLGEELELQGWSGVILLMIGVALVATDPGEKVEGH